MTETTTFKTKSGKDVWLSHLKFASTYEGCLEGNAKTNSFYMRQHGLDTYVKRHFPDVNAVVVFDDGAVELANYQWIVLLRADSISNNSDCMSQMVLSWFSNDFPENVPAMIAEIVRQVNWETQAEEYDFTLM